MLTPLNDRVIIQRTKPEEKTIGGIVIPNASEEKTTTGIVIACANGKVKSGDTVLFSKYAGIEFKIGAEDVLIVKYDELIAKI